MSVADKKRVEASLVQLGIEMGMQDTAKFWWGKEIYSNAMGIEQTWRCYAEWRF